MLENNSQENLYQRAILLSKIINIGLQNLLQKKKFEDKIGSCYLLAAVCIGIKSFKLTTRLGPLLRLPDSKYLIIFADVCANELVWLHTSSIGINSSLKNLEYEVCFYRNKLQWSAIIKYSRWNIEVLALPSEQRLTWINVSRVMYFYLNKPSDIFCANFWMSVQ